MDRNTFALSTTRSESEPTTPRSEVTRRRADSDSDTASVLEESQTLVETLKAAAEEQRANAKNFYRDFVRRGSSTGGDT